MQHPSQIGCKTWTKTSWTKSDSKKCRQKSVDKNVVDKKVSTKRAKKDLRISPRMSSKKMSISKILQKNFTFLKIPCLILLMNCNVLLLCMKNYTCNTICFFNEYVPSSSSLFFSAKKCWFDDICQIRNDFVLH